MKKKAFLTVDSGGSKTKLVLYGPNGNFIGSCTSAGFGTAQDSESVIDELASLLSEFCDGYEVSPIICNLGGKNKRQAELTISAAFPQARVEVFRESEGTIGLALCEKYSAGVTLMAGTGAIAIAKAGDKAIICGGWGANISDRGSGYQLGLDAIRLALDELDGTCALSLLTKTLTGIDEPPSAMDAREYCAFRDGVRGSLSPFDRSHVASFAKTVYDCAQLGDGRSLELYYGVGRDLAHTVITAAKKRAEALTCIVVNGGMVNALEFWQKSFEDELFAEYGKIKIHYLKSGIDEIMCDMAKRIIKGE